MNKQKNYIRTSIGFSQDQYKYLEAVADTKGQSVATVIRDIVNTENMCNSFVADIDNLKNKLQELKKLNVLTDINIHNDYIEFTIYNNLTHKYYRNMRGYMQCSSFVEAIEVGYKFHKLLMD